jgi:quercetin dioxygenase-like cupin family protein
MKRFSKKDLEALDGSWTVFEGTERSQAALMRLGEGEQSGEYGSEHPGSDQWLYCLGGSGTVKCEGKESEFSSGDLVLIPAPAKHQVIGGPCVILNFYAPPAYPAGDFEK